MCRILFWQAAVIASVTGDRVPVDQLALMRAGQLFGPGTSHPSIRRASVVLDVLEGPSQAAITAPAEAARLHPLIRSAFLVLRDHGADPAIALARAIRLAAPERAKAYSFAPVVPGPWPGPWPGVEAEAQLAWWLDALRAGCEEAMAQLSELDAWRRRADRVIDGWSGRTPSRLIKVIGAWPVLSAAMAEADTCASRAAIQRNLDRLEREGLVREVTGQDRYRLWAANLDAPSPTLARSSPD